MRISPSAIRNAVMDPHYRIPRDTPPAPSTDSSLRKAIREYHASGSHAARASLETGLSGQYWTRNQGLTKAKIARDLLDTYIRLATPDQRIAAGAAGRTITWGGHQIAANIDVLLSDPRGHVGRLCLTGTTSRPLNNTDLALIAAAPMRGLLEEFEGTLFNNLIIEIEVWELRTSTTSIVNRQQAEAAWPQLLQHLQRAIG